MTLITLTKTNNSEAFSINSNQIIDVVSSGSGSIVRYYNNAQVLENIIVDESPSSIASSAGNLFSAAVVGGTIYINISEVIVVLTNGTGSKITYDTKADSPIIQNSTESRNDIISSIQNASYSFTKAYGLYLTNNVSISSFPDSNDFTLTEVDTSENISFSSNEITIEVTGKYQIQVGLDVVIEQIAPYSSIGDNNTLGAVGALIKVNGVPQSTKTTTYLAKQINGVPILADASNPPSRMFNIDLVKGDVVRISYNFIKIEPSNFLSEINFSIIGSLYINKPN